MYVDYYCWNHFLSKVFDMVSLECLFKNLFSRNVGLWFFNYCYKHVRRPIQIINVMWNKQISKVSECFFNASYNIIYQHCSSIFILYIRSLMHTYIDIWVSTVQNVVQLRFLNLNKLQLIILGSCNTHITTQLTS